MVNYSHQTVKAKRINVALQKESDIQRSMIDLLKYKRFVVFKHRNVGIWKRETERYIPLSSGEKGISDILASLRRPVLGNRS
jgi:hypothetical protein